MLSGIRLQTDWDRLPSPDRRTAERYPERFDLEFEVSHESHFYTGLSQDISEGGLFVATYHYVPVGTPLRLSLELPGGERVEARGEVRWVREVLLGDAPPGIGVAFTELAPTTREQIARICEQHPPLYVDF